MHDSLLGQDDDLALREVGGARDVGLDHDRTEGIVRVGEIGEVGPVVVAGLESLGAIERSSGGGAVVGFLAGTDRGVTAPEDSLAVEVAGSE